MAKNRFENQTVWITGASSGIGRELARQLSAEGAAVALSGRRVDRLNEAADEIRDAGGQAFAVPCDVTDEDSVFDAVNHVLELGGQLDCVIANAGFGVAGRIEDVTADEWRRQFDTNVVGLATTARAALPHIRNQNGRVVLIGSVSGFVAVPGNGPYHASKYAVRAIGQTLSMELNGTGSTCTTIHPGFVESEIGQVGNDGEFRSDWTDKRPSQLMWKTEDAARVMINAIHRRKREYVFTGHGKAAAFVGRHAPWLVHHVTGMMGNSYKRR